LVLKLMSTLLLLLLPMLLELRVLVLELLLLTLLLLLLLVVVALVLDLVKLVVTALLLLLVWTYGVWEVGKVVEPTEELLGLIEVRPVAVGIAGPGGAVAGTFVLILTLTFDPCTTIEDRVCRGGEKTYGVLLCEDMEWAGKPLPPLILL